MEKLALGFCSLRCVGWVQGVEGNQNIKIWWSPGVLTCGLIIALGRL